MKKNKLISEEFVTRSIVYWLSCHGWGRSLQFKGKHDKGVDIRVQHSRYGVYFLVETKGESATKQLHDSAFINSLGQIITRMNVLKGRYKYGLGLPASSAKIAVRRLPWQIAKKLSLYILSVDSKGKVTLYSWKELKNK